MVGRGGSIIISSICKMPNSSRLRLKNVKPVVDTGQLDFALDDAFKFKFDAAMFGLFHISMD